MFLNCLFIFLTPFDFNSSIYIFLNPFPLVNYSTWKQHQISKLLFSWPFILSTADPFTRSNPLYFSLINKGVNCVNKHLLCTLKHENKYIQLSNTPWIAQLASWRVEWLNLCWKWTLDVFKTSEINQSTIKYNSTQV